jgi:hypothetical protein
MVPDALFHIQKQTKHSSKSKDREMCMNQNQLNRLLDKPYWPPNLEADRIYVTTHDDHDGEPLTGYLLISVDHMGDAYISVHGERLRFRTKGGGGKFSKIRSALVLLAEAIRQEGEDPFQDRKDPPEQYVEQETRMCEYCDSCPLQSPCALEPERPPCASSRFEEAANANRDYTAALIDLEHLAQNFDVYKKANDSRILREVIQRLAQHFVTRKS